MHLYSIYTRQGKPGDSQYYGHYFIWAADQLAAEVHFHNRLKHAVIQNTFLVGVADFTTPILMLGC